MAGPAANASALPAASAAISPAPVKLVRVEKKAADIQPPTPASPAPIKSTRAEKKAAKEAAETPTTAEAGPAEGGGPGMVWVNVKTHVYHEQGSRYYGTTKTGKYISEQDALAEGDHAAGQK